MSKPYRTAYLDPDNRRIAKTQHYCVRCNRDLKPGQNFRWVHLVGGGLRALHPDDEAVYASAFPAGDPGDTGFHPIGEDCATTIGFGFTSPQIDPREPDPAREGIFRDHNCWKCQSGKQPCVAGNPSRCEYPHARND